ncbi:hypothetical protein CALVIDRAFT_528916 [Calocera viscosa TUFC12733]|uniref:Rab-GAP TBC domain-containing protein n=1 Tax=Calocera viscosa (strain TUFC12733) TaxID=1330018 RepID=A0A167K0U6_CALVF|nr:hypothetical protein CALVIDRAFT_528916 [Calocera viscosa TUFC12733]
MDTNEVEEAVSAGDIQKLRELSLRPGGFGDARRVAWPYLLQVDPSEPIASSSSSSSSSSLITPPPPLDDPHKDECQIKLDTDRSFVLYPTLHDTPKDRLKTRLNALITRVLRRRRALSYVQGYHDVLSVLQLTLCPGEEPTEEAQWVLQRCAERISLFRFRDAMGPGLEPLLGLLRILRRLLRLADPPYARLIEKTTPLPYYALSNLLTLFAHDVPTLPLIQHIWDFLLAWEPVMTVYLAAALILERKEEVLRRVEEEGDEGAMYVLLSGLPPLIDSPTLPPPSEPSDTPPPTPSDTGSNSNSEPPPYTPSSSSSPGPPVLLPSLLRAAQDLYARFPPEHEALKLGQTLGEGSVHRAPWPPDISEEEAESLVLRPGALVLSLDADDDEPSDLSELKGTAAARARSRNQEMRTLMAVLVVGAGVMIAIYGAEGGLRGVDWRGLASVGVGIVREGAGRMARGG